MHAPVTSETSHVGEIKYHVKLTLYVHVHHRMQFVVKGIYTMSCHETAEKKAIHRTENETLEVSVVTEEMGVAKNVCGEALVC